MKSDKLQGILVTQKETLYGYPYRKKPLKRTLQTIVKSLQHITHVKSKNSNNEAVFSTHNIEGDVYEAIASMPDRFRKKIND